jgi:RNA polymerase sigma factor (sigma-70 family)
MGGAVSRGPARLRGLELPPKHDGELLARVAGGDVHALGRLYDAYAPMLLRFALRLGAAGDAEDVVQNVFLRVVKLAPKFDHEATSARAWLFSITTHLIQERRRSLRRFASALTGLTMQRKTAVANLAPDSSDIVRCLQKVSDAKRTVIVLAEVEGFSCEEIARMLAIPVGTVWTRLHHARKELRAALEDAR